MIKKHKKFKRRAKNFGCFKNKKSCFLQNFCFFINNLFFGEEKKEKTGKIFNNFCAESKVKDESQLRFEIKFQCSVRMGLDLNGSLNSEEHIEKIEKKKLIEKHLKINN